MVYVEKFGGYIADNPITAHVSQRLLQANADGLRKGWVWKRLAGKAA